MPHGKLIGLIGLSAYLERSEVDSDDDQMWLVLTVEEFILKYLGFKNMNKEMDNICEDLSSGCAKWEETVANYRWQRGERRKALDRKR